MRDTALPFDDRGLAYGDGLFESIAVRGGQVRRIAQHLNRLQNGAAILGLSLPANATELANALEQVRTANDVEDGVLRLTLSRGAALRGLLPAWLMGCSHLPRLHRLRCHLVCLARGRIDPRVLPSLYTAPSCETYAAR